MIVFCETLKDAVVQLVFLYHRVTQSKSTEKHRAFG